jgi:hypothetical protein
MKTKKNIFEDAEDNLNKIAPKLFSSGNDIPFDVPENYFDSLPAIIVEKCSNPAKTRLAGKFKAVLNSGFLIPAAVSIAVLIIAFMIYHASNVKTSNRQTMAYTESNSSAEVLYVDSLIDNGEMDESMLVETAAGIDDTSKNVKPNSSIEKNIAELNKSTVILNDSTNKVIITDDDIINYLLDNDDADDIINY